jgi:TolA-binding protein
MQPIRDFAAALLLGLAILALGWPARADSLDQLAKKLVAMRSDVEELQAQLETEQNEHVQRLRSLGSQRAELEASVRREELKVKRLQTVLGQARERLKEHSVQVEELMPVAKEVIAALHQSIDASLPFQLDNRRAAVAELERQLDEGSLPPARVLSRLWAFYEDEVRLATESGMYRQAVEIGDKKVLADVVRIGMVMLFFRTEESVGYVEKSGEEWAFRTVESTADRDRLQALFDAFDKQIRTGLFEIPNPRGVR